VFLIAQGELIWYSEWLESTTQESFDQALGGFLETMDTAAVQQHLLEPGERYAPVSVTTDGWKPKHGGANAYVELFATGFTSVVLHFATVLMRTMSVFGISALSCFPVFDNSGALAMGARWVCGGGHGSQGVAMYVFYTSSFLSPVPPGHLAQNS